MPNDILLPIQAGTLPSGFCPGSYQDMLNGFSAVQNAVASSGGSGGAPVTTNFIASVTKPSDTTAAWLQLGTDFRPVRLYYFFGNLWLSLHPIVPGLTMWWFNAIAGDPNAYVRSFDGGDGGSLPNSSGTAGPMWQLAQDANNNVIAAMFPVVAGTLPSGKILSVPLSGGEENHKLIGSEVAPHIHTLNGVGLNADAPSGAPTLNSTSPNFVGTRGKTGASQSGDVSTNPNVGSGDSMNATAHNTMPPYVVGYLFQRTTRLYYTVAA